MSSKKLTCPVCGAEKKAETQSLSCAECGCSGAYYTLFSGPRAYEMWQSLIDKHKAEYAGSLCKKSRESGSSLHVTGDRVCFYNGGSKEAVVVKFNNDKPELLENTKQVSLCGLYRAWLLEDGTVMSSGDNESGQRRLADIRDAAFVATSPKCTYVVKTDGTVTVRGASQVSDEVSRWTDIAKVVCEGELVVGIRKDGTVVYALAEGAAFEPFAPVMKGWKDVRDVAVGGQYVIALHNDGSVSYTGENNERSEAAKWKNMTAIAADAQYAVGLTETGDVVLAGRKSALVDFGRSEAAKWKDVVYIAAGRAVIAGLTSSGELKLCGIMSKEDGLDETFKETVYTSLSKKQ